MTTIKDFAARLDDYTGTLVQEVEKLDLERAQGGLNRDEQMDLLGDLRQAVEERLIRPWRKRVWILLLLGLALIGGGVFLPDGIPNATILRCSAAVCGALSLVLAGYGALAVRKYRTRECAWLNDLETTLNKGGSVFDAR
jgi:hypothetical protein